MFGLGAFRDPVLAYYDIRKKQYRERKFKGMYEAGGVTGNIAWHKGEPIVHCHLVVSDVKCRAFAGHLVSALVGGTLELMILPTAPLRRAFDATTGLKLLLHTSST